MADERDPAPAKDEKALLQLLEKWWTPPDELIATIPKGGVSLKYLGHSDTTRALTESDPFWSWEPLALDERGAPLMDYAGPAPVGLWIRLTVHGVTRPAYGSCEPGKRDAVKELIGDAIRNGAMRFGVAGSLWSKADDARAEKPKPKRRAPRKAPDPEEHEVRRAGVERYEKLCEEFGKKAVDGALAVFSIGRFSEFTAAREIDVRASLVSHRAAKDATAIIEQQFGGINEKAE